MITRDKLAGTMRGRSRVRCTLLVASLTAMGLITTPGVASADESIDPPFVEATLYPGDSIEVDKTVGTNSIPPKVDVCLLQDETGSFSDDQANLKNPATIAAIFDGVRAESLDSQFAVAGFRDFPIFPRGGAADFVYRLRSAMSADFSNWSAGINALTAGGGGDLPEAQYPAIRAAVEGGFGQASCGFRADPQVARVLVVTTDAPFHANPTDGGVYGDLASTLAVLDAANVTVIGLKAPGAGTELNSLAAATGGSVQALASDGANIAAAILAGLGNLPIEVAMTSTCTDPISTTFEPPTQSVTSGDDAFFTETIAVAAGAAGGTYSCVDNVSYNGVVSETIEETKTIHVIGIELSPVTDINELGFDLSHTVTATVSAGDAGPIQNAGVDITITSGPNAGETISGQTDANGELSLTWTPTVAPASLGTDVITADLKNPDGDVVASDDAGKDWVDTTPPSATCVASVNPGGNIPQAPGKGGQGQNQDGFYLIGGSDVVWGSDVDVFVVDDGSGTVFGPYAPDTNIKYTQAPGATPTAKSIGGPNSAVKLHIKGTGDAAVYTVDGSGNIGGPVSCLVPPAPK